MKIFSDCTLNFQRKIPITRRRKLLVLIHSTVLVFKTKVECKFHLITKVLVGMGGLGICLYVININQMS